MNDAIGAPLPSTVVVVEVALRLNRAGNPGLRLSKYCRQSGQKLTAADSCREFVTPELVELVSEVGP